MQDTRCVLVKPLTGKGFPIASIPWIGAVLFNHQLDPSPPPGWLAFHVERYYARNTFYTPYPALIVCRCWVLPDIESCFFREIRLLAARVFQDPLL